MSNGFETCTKECGDIAGASGTGAQSRVEGVGLDGGSTRAHGVFEDRSYESRRDTFLAITLADVEAGD